MLGIGGFNPAQMVSQAALGVATGGSSIIAQLAMQIVSQIAKDLIQQLGQQIGLPQPMIDAAQGAFDMASGNPAGAAQEFGQAAQGAAAATLGAAAALNLSPTQTGELQRTTEDAKSAVEKQMETYLKEALEGKDDDGASKSAKKNAKQAANGESFLVKLAVALGKAIDAKMDDQLKLAKEIDGAKASKDESHMSEMTARLQALSQEISLMSNAMTNSIKTIGESLSTIARKN